MAIFCWFCVSVSSWNGHFIWKIYKTYTANCHFPWKWSNYCENCNFLWNRLNFHENDPLESITFFGRKFKTNIFQDENLNFFPMKISTKIFYLIFSTNNKNSSRRLWTQWWIWLSSVLHVEAFDEDFGSRTSSWNIRATNRWHQGSLQQLLIEQYENKMPQHPFSINFSLQFFINGSHYSIQQLPLTLYDCVLRGETDNFVWD